VYAKWGVLTALVVVELFVLELTEPELVVLDAPLGLIGEDVGVEVLDEFVGEVEFGAGDVGKTVVFDPPKPPPPLRTT